VEENYFCAFYVYILLLPKNYNKFYKSVYFSKNLCFTILSKKNFLERNISFEFFPLIKRGKMCLNECFSY
jgi:hypothetical protein